MALDRENSHEIRGDGLLFTGGVNLSSDASTPTHSANVGDRHFKADGSVFINVSDPSPGTTWQEITMGGSQGGIIHATWADALAGNIGLETPQETYEVVAHILYSGSLRVGSISTIDVTFMNEDILDPIDVKIFDKTGGNTIVEKTNIAGATSFVFEVVDLGTLSNIPTIKSVLELQIRLVDGTGAGPPNPSWVSTVLMELL